MKHDLELYLSMMGAEFSEVMPIKTMVMWKSNDLTENTTHTMNDLDQDDQQQTQKKIQKITENLLDLLDMPTTRLQSKPKTVSPVIPNPLNRGDFLCEQYDRILI